MVALSKNKRKYTMSSTSPLSSLEGYLRLTNAREQIVTANMANVDTPGYRTRDIDFQHELNRAMHAGASQTSTAQTSPVAYEVGNLLERPDGNNVSLDREGTLLAEVQLQHEIGVQLIKHHFHSLLSAINGGGQ
jgi:flagellar basal-body rod protein FlgB